MQITLDPTHADHTSLEVEGRISKFPHAKRDSGAALISRLAQLKISAKDELRVVVGPGNFTATRAACLIGNAVQLATKCRLFARKKNAAGFRGVNSLQPYYACAPSITTPRND